jgi:hypothetical protein
MSQLLHVVRKHLVDVSLVCGAVALLFLGYLLWPASDTALPPPEFQPSQLVTETPPPGKTGVLSDERTRTLSAYVRDPRAIRAAPNDSSPRIARLRMTTEEGYLEPYLVRRVHTDRQGRVWTEVRIPGRPNGRVGWVRRNALEPFKETPTLLVVDRSRLTIGLYRNGHRRWERPVAIGAGATPTPAGRFSIRERIKIRDRHSPYWPYALGTSAYSSLPGWPGGGVVAIHGDVQQPGLIPGRVSHGCIRLHDQDMAWLAQRVDVGTPLLII